MPTFHVVIKGLIDTTTQEMQKAEQAMPRIVGRIMRDKGEVAYGGKVYYKKQLGLAIKAIKINGNYTVTELPPNRPL